jgi:hypothetical protein
MQNTFWTLINNQYYRVHNGELKYAPACQYTNEVLLQEESKVEVMTGELLEQINEVFGLKLNLDDI